MTPFPQLARTQSDRQVPAGPGPFGAVHVFPDGPGDVPDESDHARLVILPPEAVHTSNEMDSPGVTAAAAILEQRHGGPRLNRNLVVFLAGDANRVPELRAAVRQWLAWTSIWSRDSSTRPIPECFP